MFDTLKWPISQAVNSYKVKILNFYMQLKIKDFIPVIFLLILLLWITLVQHNINEDNIINVIDIVSVVNLILEGGEPTCNSDINQDGIVNVIDIVALVNLILSS